MNEAREGFIMMPSRLSNLAICRLNLVKNKEKKIIFERIVVSFFFFSLEQLR